MKRPRNANDHEQKARVHPAQPYYSVVVPAPELSSLDVAVEQQIGMSRTLRKSAVPVYRFRYCGTSLTTGPLGAGAGAGCSTF
jgi:hypothetical protein